jgi:hypothetical protein
MVFRFFLQIILTLLEKFYVKSLFDGFDNLIKSGKVDKSQIVQSFESFLE